jgi:hypothetical protein
MLPGLSPFDRNRSNGKRCEENIMSYAVYRDGDRISRPFQTEGDAWDCANDAGLVENVPSGGGAVQVLDSHCTIEPCDGELVMPANLA